MITKYKLQNSVVTELNNHIQEIMELCRVHQIPGYISLAIENTEEKTVYSNHVYGTKSHNIKLQTDNITAHELIGAGFKAVPPRNVISVDVEELYGE